MESLLATAKREKLTTLFSRLASAPASSAVSSLEVLHAHFVATGSTVALSLSLRDAWTDAKRSTEDIDAVELAHRSLGLLGGVHVHEAVAWVSSRERVRRHADAHDGEAVALEQFLDVGSLCRIQEVADIESRACGRFVATARLLL